VPRACDILGPTKEWKGEKIKIGKFNIKSILKKDTRSSAGEWCVEEKIQP
jgi:hypothetical protein